MVLLNRSPNILLSLLRECAAIGLSSIINVSLEYYIQNDSSFGSYPLTRAYALKQACKGLSRLRPHPHIDTKKAGNDGNGDLNVKIGPKYNFFHTEFWYTRLHFFSLPPGSTSLGDGAVLYPGTTPVASQA